LACELKRVIINSFGGENMAKGIGSMMRTKVKRTPFGNSISPKQRLALAARRKALKTGATPVAKP